MSWYLVRQFINGVLLASIACKAETCGDALRLAREWGNTNAQGSGETISGYFCSMPAPGDLCEWLDAELHKWQLKPCRMAVPGGWMYLEIEEYNGGPFGGAPFVPVANAGGIIIVEGDNA